MHSEAEDRGSRKQISSTNEVKGSDIANTSSPTQVVRFELVDAYTLNKLVFPNDFFFYPPDNAYHLHRKLISTFDGVRGETPFVWFDSGTPLAHWGGAWCFNPGPTSTDNFRLDFQTVPGTKPFVTESWTMFI
ncbi:MAG: hypothetical protein LBU03_04045 [Tannerellaceae bacterium]|jgi:hypothetical protein|nr:hypothetical protein [Tannerellaceae bacterium]